MGPAGTSGRGWGGVPRWVAGVTRRGNVTGRRQITAKIRVFDDHDKCVCERGGGGAAVVPA